MKNLVILFPFLVLSAMAFSQKINHDRLLEEHIKKLDLAHAQAILTGDVAAIGHLDE